MVNAELQSLFQQYADPATKLLAYSDLLRLLDAHYTTNTAAARARPRISCIDVSPVFLLSKSGSPKYARIL